MKRKCFYCQRVKHCKFYRYNSFDSLGWLCYRCSRKIDLSISSIPLSIFDYFLY